MHLGHTVALSLQVSGQQRRDIDLVVEDRDVGRGLHGGWWALGWLPGLDDCNRSFPMRSMLKQDCFQHSSGQLRVHALAHRHVRVTSMRIMEGMPAIRTLACVLPQWPHAHYWPVIAGTWHVAGSGVRTRTYRGTFILTNHIASFPPGRTTPYRR